ncbi:MAG: hypothetical protein HS111_30440 [Kofleriaceae bacterium]|nr:hypothetical protein [Kofleriaceae bacterium]MCL4224647.1 hypothetical protein [Myxococcales bacterium]
MTLTRKQFLAALGTGAAFGALAACGGDDGDDGGGVDAPPAACALNENIGSNHGHVLTVSAADVQAGTERTYDIQGSSIHGHSVTLTATHFAMLAQNQTVSVTSTSSGGHSHTVTITC